MEQSTHQMAINYTRMSKEMDDLYHELALRAKLSDSALDILYALCALGDGCLQRDICALSFTSKQTINSAIRKMEREGLLYLMPGRGRDLHICLTCAGRSLAQEHVQPVLDMECRALEALTPEDREVLLRLTRTYVSRFREQVYQGELQ